MFLRPENITEEKLATIRKLNEVAGSRGQTLAEIALSWVLRGNKVTSVLIGASSKEQIKTNIKFVDNLEFTPEELAVIEEILK